MARKGIALYLAGAVAAVVALGVFESAQEKPDLKKTPFVEVGSPAGRAQTMYAEAGFSKVTFKHVGDPKQGSCGYDSASTAEAWKADANTTVTIVIACPIRTMPWVTYGGTVARVTSDLAKAGFDNTRVNSNRHQGRTSNCKVQSVRIQPVEATHMWLLDNRMTHQDKAWTGDLIELEEGCELDP